MIKNFWNGEAKRKQAVIAATIDNQSSGNSSFIEFEMGNANYHL
jgi:hypothetical protein